MRKRSVKLLVLSASMMLTMGVTTACGAKDIQVTSEEAQKIGSEAVSEADKLMGQVDDVVDSTDKIVEELDKENQIIDSISGDMDLSGSWKDLESKAASMTAVKNSDGSYDIRVTWAKDADEIAYWDIHGTYDSKAGMLTYEDGAYTLHTLDDDGNDTVSIEETTKGGFFKEDANLRWQDSQIEKDGLFEKFADDSSASGDEAAKEESPEKASSGDSADEDYISVLPDYVYKDGDPIMAAITQYLIVEYKGFYPACDVSIPCPLIVDKDETNPDDVLVWGDFWLENYKLQGDTLVEESGGSYPGLMHLKSSDNGYEVTSFEVVADGSDYDESCKEIFGDKVDKLVELNGNEEEKASTRGEIISSYVKSHSLDITKYQLSGSDPVELPQ